MTKVFFYELRRLLLNKFFAALLLMTLFLSYSTLTDEIILGAAGTAPFSPWSFGLYLSKVMPILCITLLFFLSMLYTRGARDVTALTNATPVKPARYLAVRVLAICAGYLLLLLIVVLGSVMFYQKLFGFTNFPSHIAPLLVSVLPCTILSLGLGSLAGRVHVGVIYGLMLALLLLAAGPIDLFGSAFFSGYPLSLPLDGLNDPPFSIPGSFAAMRAVLCAVGLVCTAFALRGRASSTRSI